VHAPTVAGISGTVEDGCYSLALSGGYADDIDLGDRFTYTGSGGRKLQGMVNGKRLNLRTAPQTFDQSFEDRCNAALLTSSKTGNPIRVIRGYKGDSIWAPSSGYLYSGLYVCTRAWLADGLSGYKVCRYAFKRLPDQDPLPIADQSSDSTSIASSPAPSRQPLTPRCNHTNCRVEVVIMVDKQKKSS
jgi:E3 ubiquitin-protein ligase UHRF1